MLQQQTAMAEKPVRIGQRDVNFDQESRRSKKLQMLRTQTDAFASVRQALNPGTTQLFSSGSLPNGIMTKRGSEGNQPLINPSKATVRNSSS